MVPSAPPQPSKPSSACTPRSTDWVRYASQRCWASLPRVRAHGASSLFFVSFDRVQPALRLFYRSSVSALRGRLPAPAASNRAPSLRRAHAHPRRTSKCHTHLYSALRQRAIELCFDRAICALFSGVRRGFERAHGGLVQAVKLAKDLVEL